VEGRVVVEKEGNKEWVWKQRSRVSWKHKHMGDFDVFLTQYSNFVM
jgi:hypothetical protein